MAKKSRQQKNRKGEGVKNKKVKGRTRENKSKTDNIPVFIVTPKKNNNKNSSKHMIIKKEK